MGRGTKIGSVSDLNGFSGLYWDANNFSGIGSSSFRWIEGGGNSSADGLQTTVANQPTVIENKTNKQFRFLDQGDGNATSIITENITAGWTGDTYVGTWIRFIEGTPTSGTNTIFNHNTATNGLKRLTLILNGTTEIIQCNLSSDGTVVVSNTWNSPTYGFWTWLEFQFLATGSAQLFYNLNIQTALTNNVNITSLNNPNVPIGLGCSSNGTGNINEQDIASIYYLNGIPSLKTRKFLMRTSKPV